MKRLSLYIIIGVSTLLLLASCGQRYEAKQLAKDFVDTYAVNPEKIDITDFSKLDSTKVISDSLVQVLRKKADPLFKNGIKYTAEKQGDKLLYIRMRFNYEGEEMAKTFYFDPDLEGIVMFK